MGPSTETPALKTSAATAVLALLHKNKHQKRASLPPPLLGTRRGGYRGSAEALLQLSSEHSATTPEGSGCPSFHVLETQQTVDADRQISYLLLFSTAWLCLSAMVRKENSVSCLHLCHQKLSTVSMLEGNQGWS